MAVDIKRRNAFAQAFKDYPHYLERFTADHCWLTDPHTSVQREPRLISERHQIMQILMAQFALRLIKTRGRDTSPEMAFFGFEAANRYHAFKKMLIGQWEIEGKEKYHKALTAIETNMATAVLDALTLEATLPDQTPDGKPTPKFEEIDFWRDVFLSFAQNQRVNHPMWLLPLQVIVLDHMAELKTALAAPVMVQ